jgi:hypothetical protein
VDDGRHSVYGSEPDRSGWPAVWHELLGRNVHYDVLMEEWKNQVSTAIETAVSTLGPTYLKCFRDNTGLPIEANRQLTEDAGLGGRAAHEPLN